MSKIVIFTQRVDVIESYNERRDSADQRISDFLFSCGFLPIPVSNNKQFVIDIINKINPSGIILTGGNSLVKYGGNSPERDDVDQEIIEIAIKRYIPIYGFCRGMQSILDYFGERLIEVDGHVKTIHNINGVEDKLLGNFNREVNSYHNQGCVSLQDNYLEILAKSEDGVIEAVKHKEFLILGTMWHPERNVSFNKSDLLMVKNFISKKDLIM